MRKIIILVAVLVLMQAGLAAGFDFGISVGDEGIRSFHLAVGDYYRVPEKQITVVKKSRLHDDEMPVVFFLAARARVSPSVILDLRLGGMSWMDISLRHGLTAAVYHMDVRSGPPYGKAWGHFKKSKRHWKKLRLGDADVVNLVNLRFMSEHYGYSPAEVMKMRDRGDGFVAINGKVKKAKGSKGGKQKEKKSGKGKGKGKNRY
jgi:hypothetical protein